ncbi:MAG: tetratricopeptide repeat protein [Phycisphaerales bacterium]|nr:tetratricopeptide repeat protein [Phycisphaerales bacterium]
MSRVRHERLQAIFEAMLALPADARGAALESACAGDPELRAEVEQLLADADRSDCLEDDAIDRGAHLAPLEPSGPADEAGPGPPTEAIPGFRILRLLGEGGMGAVYEAEQGRPRRRVALKLIRSSLVTETLRRRFRREAEALGRLKHPGIAQIYMVGVGGDGRSARPYLAMELIEGQAVTTFARSRNLDLRARLELAARLCDAVEHAHQRGVIHRDLKPANVLVDESGQLKVLDFGIARLTDSDVMLTTLRTEVGEIVGTAAYMSPEQASGDPDDLDTRSDVYSLGVVIYELLCGRLPVDVDRLPLPDAIRAIREVEATRIGSLDTRLRGDVETILGKTLQHDKSQRYQSASELGADIRRFLHDEPIVARPPSTIYRLRKFARRNRLLVSAVCAIGLALSAGLVATSIALRREAAARARTEESLERSLASSAFLEQVLLGLGPDRTQGLDTRLLELMLDQAESTLDGTVAHPAVRAEMLAIVGRVRHSIFDFDHAAVLLRASDELYASLGSEYDSARDRTCLVYADALMKSGRTDDAARLLQVAIDRFARLGDGRQGMQATRQLAELRMDAGQWDEALVLIERSLALATDVPDAERGRAEMMHGAILRRLMRREEARSAYERALELYRGADARIEQATVLNSLGILARDEGRTDDAERLYREAIALRRLVDPRPNPAVATLLSNLGRLLGGAGRLDEAAAVLEESLQMHKDVNGERHFTVAYPSVSLGEIRSMQGDHDRGLELIDDGLALIEGQFGRQHPVYVSMLLRRGEARRRAAQYDASRVDFEDAIALVAELPANQTALDVSARIGLAETLRASGDPERALAVLEAALERAVESESDADRLRTVIADIESDSNGLER